VAESVETAVIIQVTTKLEEPMEEPINAALKNIDILIHIRKSERLGVASADWESSEQAYRKRIHRKKRYSGIEETRLLR
jgi:hypothetical protein